MRSNVNRRHLLRTAGVAGIATATVGAIGSPAQSAPDPTGQTGAAAAQATTPQDFGAVADGVADDTEAVQQAIDAQRDRKNKFVYFPPGTYRITRTLVIPDVEGDGGANLNRTVLAGAGTMGSRTSVIDVDFDGTGIQVRAPLAALRGLGFVVAASLKNSVALHIARDPDATSANTDDMDATITECTFVEFFTAVKHVGRGLVFTNNLVAVGDVGLDISWPTEGVSGDGVHLLPYGMRKWLIEGNHFHSMGLAIATSGADAHNFRGAVVANNVLDIGRRLFSGGIINSTFSGNVVENGSSGSVVAVTSGGTNLTFSGNVLGGGDPGGGGRPKHAIEFRPDATARNVTITGNSFNWIEGSPVYFAGATSEVTVSANSFDHWNLDEEERWSAIRVNADATGVAVMGNAFGANPVAKAPPIRVVGKLSGSTITGNLFDNTGGVLHAESVGDENYIERRSAGANQHELTAAKNGALVVRSSATGAPDVGSDAYGSFVAASEQSAGAGPGVKGGLRVVPANESGASAVELLCATNSTNGVAVMRVDINGLVPTADNARDVGSKENRVRTVHAHTLALATVAAADLPEPAPGAVVMVKGPSDSPMLAISDGKAWRHLPLGEPIATT
ncbi:Pectate lyase superfamily protein [Streptomyces sp. YIM 130001]|uniref:glycosyl hydrolase family 28-related protein n=1 Tax=Streptomyces sp. YIM 130001 TaxID=2259644 RepID=UPI000ED214CA|nr:glycosyl hydrolase family 28-related protein [Streptomyces sp. YIM 130001]RII17873.1 Pectate lyase superfamily protein [Streptomyces sp. YIM 130001]